MMKTLSWNVFSHLPRALCRYRLNADSPCAMRDRGQKDRRRQLEKAVSQGSKAVVKVMTYKLCTGIEHGTQSVDQRRLMPFIYPTCVALF